MKRPMPHIPLGADLHCIVRLFDYRPETARPLCELTKVLLRGPPVLTHPARQLIAIYALTLNEGEFCAQSLGVIAKAHSEHTLTRCVSSGHDTGPIGDGFQMPLGMVSSAPRRHQVESTEAAPPASSAPHYAIRDTVLIAAAFCVCNRYVDCRATEPVTVHGYDHAVQSILSSEHTQ